MRYKIWFILLAALLVAACSKESGQTVTPGPAPVDNGSSPDPNPDPNPAPAVQDVPLYLVAATRGTGEMYVDAADDYETYAPIQFFLMSGDRESAITQKREGLFTYNPDARGWTSTIGIKDPKNCIYGFSPATAASCAISPASGTSYDGGAVLKMTNLNAASGNDLCVIVGVRHGTSKAATNETPERGNFFFTMDAENYISLLLDHVLARIDFKIKIGPEYARMRYIKIKKLELQSSYQLTGITVTLKRGADIEVGYDTSKIAESGTPSTGILYDFSADTDPANSEGKDITPDGTVFPGFFAPDDASQIAKGLSLVCTYDIYAIDAFNNNKIGSRVRENCVAVNSLASVPSLASMRRGKKTSLTLTVEPTYLYQLSEDELDNPSIRIED